MGQDMVFIRVCSTLYVGTKKSPGVGGVHACWVEPKSLEVEAADWLEWAHVDADVVVADALYKYISFKTSV